MFPPIISAWLKDTVDQLATKAKSNCGKTPPTVDVTIVPYAFPNKESAHVAIYQVGGEPPHPYIEQWAFDYTFTVPPGGYDARNFPSTGGRFTFYFKDGSYMRRRWAYSRKSGQTITRKGYFSQAAEQVFTKAHLDTLSRPLAQAVAISLTARIQMAAARQGNVATVI